MVYLDNAATTYPKSERVYRALDEANRSLAFNSGRGSYKGARNATKIMDNVKLQLLKLVNAPACATVVFTSSITVAINEILNGITFEYGDVIYVSPYEHNSVARVVHLLEKRKGVKLRELPVTSDSLEIDIEKMKYIFSKEEPKCVCCTHVSNVTGYILPVDEIFNVSKKHGAITVLDTAQSLGLIDIDCGNAEIDFLAFAGHKTLYGPLGIGGFIDFKTVSLEEFIVGGTGSDSLNLDMPQVSPAKFEASSANIVAIKGLGAALDEITEFDAYEHDKKLVNYLVSRLGEIDGIKMYLPPQNKHISIVSFSVENYKSEDVGMILDEDYDIAVRTGYHCAPLIHKWLKDEESLGTVRVGVGKFNSKKDIDALCNALEEL